MRLPLLLPLLLVPLLSLPQASRAADRITGRDFATRSEVIAPQAMAATSHPLATQIALDVMKEALATFHGVARRFSVVGEPNGITLVDDYGHHPAEIRATLAAARRSYGGRVLVAMDTRSTSGNGMIVSRPA